MTERLRQAISDLAHVIGEQTLSTMVGPYTAPFGKIVRGGGPGVARHEPPVEGVESPEGKSLIGPETDEPGGDPEFYGKEKKHGDIPATRLKEQDTIPTSKAPDPGEPKGTSIVGKTPKAEKEGNPEYYKPEKPLRDLDTPLKDKPQGRGADLERKERDVPYMGKLKEQKEPPPASTWEIYARSGPLDAEIAKAVEAVKPHGEEPFAALAVKLRAASPEGAIEALKGVGFEVIDYHREPAGRARFTEEEETLTKHLIDAIFQIDQAIGSLEIVHEGLRKDPDVDPGVRDEVMNNVARLEAVARRLEKLRGKVL
jgi:hypothetical protein